jgi:hypothetical protein
MSITTNNISKLAYGPKKGHPLHTIPTQVITLDECKSAYRTIRYLHIHTGLQI